MAELVVGTLCAVGMYLLVTVVAHPRVPLWLDIARYVSVLEFPTPTIAKRIGYRIKHVLQEHPKSLAGSDRDVTQWLLQSGKSELLTTFRREQLNNAACAELLVAGWLCLRALGHKPVTMPTGFVLSVGAGLAGIWFAKWRLVRAVSHRRIAAEASLPTVLELLAFSVSAGEPMLGSVHRVAQTCSGPLVEELRIALADISMGVSLVDAFAALGNRMNSPHITRSLKAIVIAIERGTPLAEILRAQASDARAARLRELLVMAGKKETAMMFPVVFFILPMIVAVALYPGFIALQGM